MKKRNMAITIAAVTAATSVAPALSFADTQSNPVIAVNDAKAVAKLKTDVQNLLNVKYTEDKDLLKDGNKAGDSVYAITYTTKKDATVKSITNMDDLNVALASLDKENEFLNITATNSGYTTINNQIVDYTTKKYEKNDIENLYTQLTADNTKTTNEVKSATVTGLETAKDALGNAKTAVEKIDPAGKLTKEKINGAVENIKEAQAALTVANDSDLTDAKLGEAKTALVKAKTALGETVNGELNSAIEAVDAIKITPATDDSSDKVPTNKPNIEAVTKVDANTLSLELLNNDTPLVIKTGDTILSIYDPEVAEYKQDAKGNYLGLDSNDKEIVLTGANSNTIAGMSERIVTGFDVQKDTPENEGDAEVFGVDYEGVITKEYKTTDLYDFTVGRFTTAGNQLSQFIKEYDEVANPSEKAIITLNDAKTELNISFPVDKTEEMYGKVLNTAQAGPATGQFADITIKGSNKELSKLEGIFNATSNVDVNELAGMNRYETAIQVSKATFTKDNNAKAVVLVSGSALADGLTATPFARQQEAPILLSDKSKVSDDTIREMQRVMPASGNKNVYVIGGENTISKDVETQIKAKGFNVVRIKGDDRYETSLEVAEKMKTYTSYASRDAKQVYVAGGYAEADAMSIAGVAAKNLSPILLANPKSGLSADQIEFLEAEAATDTKDKTTTPYIIGGADKAPEVIKTQIKEEAKLATPERLSGLDRQGTNAAVIKEFYTTGMDKLYVAKSDDKGLVDALSAGALAGKEKAPVLLATDSLNAEQKAVVKAIGVNENAQKTQIGYGIAGQVWTTITDLFKN